MECPRWNSWGRGDETSKRQWVNSKLESFRIHKLNFEIISKWSFNLVQLSSNGHNFFISTPICTLFEALDSWLPEIWKIYSMSKMDSRKCSKFFLKFKVYVTTKFWVLNFHAAESCFMPHFSCLLAFFSYSIMVISHLPNSWYPCLAFPHGPWVLTRLFPHWTLSWSFKI